jgi:predicted acylesterase/phospholipase RssA
VVDVERLVERIYMHEFPLDYASVLATPIELHPLATDIDTGEVADLHRDLTDCHTLRLAIRASAALPVLAGAPISLGGRRYFDAGLAESVPFRQALRDGATHVLVLRSRPALAAPGRAPAGQSGPTATGSVTPSLGSRFVANVALRRHPAPLRASYLCRAARLVDDDLVLAAYDAGAAPLGTSAVLSIRPDPAAPSIGRLETNSSLLEEAFEIGHQAVHTWHAQAEAAFERGRPAAGRVAA